MKFTAGSATAISTIFQLRQHSSALPVLSFCCQLHECTLFATISSLGTLQGVCVHTWSEVDGFNPCFEISSGPYDIDFWPFCPKIWLTVTSAGKNISTKFVVSTRFHSGLMGPNGTCRQTDGQQHCRLRPLPDGGRVMIAFCCEIIIPGWLMKVCVP